VKAVGADLAGQIRAADHVRIRVDVGGQQFLAALE
jgi:hypothetical protein